METVAREGFDDAAEAYDRSRPSYPPEALDWFVERLRLRPGARVADLAAGTGIFTQLLEPLGARLVAAEPVAGMRAQLRRRVPTVPTVAAPAEAMPFASASLDAVTVAQAFHWFDVAAATAELRRVLRVGGRLGLLWNARDRREEWVDRVWSVMDRVEKHAPWRDHDHRSTRDPHVRRDDVIGDAAGFAPVDAATFHHVQVLPPAGVLDRVRGVSHVAVLPIEQRDAVLTEVASILATHPETRGRSELRIPYRVDCYWTERVA